MWHILRWARHLVTAIGCWWLFVTLSPVNEWWANRLASPWYADTGGEVLIVLAGDNNPDPILGASSYWRSVYAVRAIRKHNFRQVIITGGAGPLQTPATSELMRDFLQAQKIDITNVSVETDSTSTQQNALRVKELIATPGKIVLLTSDYHCWRSIRVFRKIGIPVESSPVPDILKRNGAWPLRAGLFMELCTETAKIFWYRWKGWI